MSQKTGAAPEDGKPAKRRMSPYALDITAALVAAWYSPWQLDKGVTVRRNEDQVMGPSARNPTYPAIGLSPPCEESTKVSRVFLLNMYSFRGE